MDRLLRPEQQREPVGAAGAGSRDGGGAGGVDCESDGVGWWRREGGVRGTGWRVDGLKGCCFSGRCRLCVGDGVDRSFGWKGDGMAQAHGNHHVTGHDETTTHRLGITTDGHVT